MLNEEQPAIPSNYTTAQDWQRLPLFMQLSFGLTNPPQRAMHLKPLKQLFGRVTWYLFELRNRGPDFLCSCSKTERWSLSQDIDLLWNYHKQFNSARWGRARLVNGDSNGQKVARRGHECSTPTRSCSEKLYLVLAVWAFLSSTAVQLWKLAYLDFSFKELIT